MPRNSITLTEHILKEEQKFPKASGNLTLLLTQIAEAGKIIASHVQNSGLIDIEGKTGKKNIYEEEVKKLDEFANDTMVRVLTESKQVFTLASEEIEKPFFTEKLAVFSKKEKNKLPQDTFFMVRVSCLCIHAEVE